MLLAIDRTHLRLRLADDYSNALRCPLWVKSRHLASITGHVRFTPESGHVPCKLDGLRSVQEAGHRQKSLGRWPGFPVLSLQERSPEDGFPRRPVKSVIDATANNVAGKFGRCLNKRPRQCRVDHAVAQVAEIIVQIFDLHRPMAHAIFEPAARRPAPQGFVSVPAGQRPTPAHPDAVNKLLALARPAARPPVP